MNTQKGQTLIEVIVALGAAVIVITAITVVVINALSNVQFSKNQNSATQYAQEGLEIVRRLRDTNYPALVALDGVHCVGEEQNWVSGIATCETRNIESTYVRQIEIDSSAPIECSDGTQVTSIVKWADGKCTDRSNLYCHEVRLVSCLSDFLTVPTP